MWGLVLKTTRFNDSESTLSLISLYTEARSDLTTLQDVFIPLQLHETSSSQIHNRALMQRNILESVPGALDVYFSKTYDYHTLLHDLLLHKYVF